ncbi:copper resistance protein [Nocardiopsis terrae]
MRPAHGTLRLTRTALLAGACTGLSWVGHNLWAASPAGAGGFLLATAFLFALLWRFTRVMRGFGDIFAVLALAQLALHLLLQGAAEPGLLALAPGTDHGGHGPLHAFGFAPGMLFAHLWAALLAAALLARGESALWSLATAVFGALPRLLGAPELAFAAPGQALTAPVPTAPPPPVPSTHGPRGPPGSSALRPGPPPDHDRSRTAGADWTRNPDRHGQPRVLRV